MLTHLSGRVYTTLSGVFLGISEPFSAVDGPNGLDGGFFSKAINPSQNNRLGAVFSRAL
jgi:hypothetical protein